jgi:hypothetical protein
MVMTPMAAEGMHIQHLVHGLVAADPGDMADSICRLLEDDDLWIDLSREGRGLVHDRFGIDNVRQLVAAALIEAARVKGMSWAS